MRRRLIAYLMLLTGLTMGACATLGIGKEDTATRIIADAQCLGAATAAGAKILVDPTLGFATAAEVMIALLQVTNDLAVQNAFTACALTFSYVKEDLDGLIAMLRSRAGYAADPQPVKLARLKAMRAVAPKTLAPDVPIKVIVPLK